MVTSIGTKRIPRASAAAWPRSESRAPRITLCPSSVRRYEVGALFGFLPVRAGHYRREQSGQRRLDLISCLWWIGGAAGPVTPAVMSFIRTGRSDSGFGGRGLLCHRFRGLPLTAPLA